MSRKPRILLIPNVSGWIIGEIGKQIIARFGHKYDFYFVSEGLLERRPDLLHSLTSAVDAIHCLNESSLPLFDDVPADSLPPIVTWIHHVTKWSPDHQRAVDRSSALTVSTTCWKKFIEPYIVRDLPLTVVRYGVDSSAFTRTAGRRSQFGIPEGRFVVGFLGSKGSNLDGGRKGIDVLFDVARGAAGQLPQLHLVLGGPGWDEELAELRARGISASATGYLRKAYLPALYSALDAYLLTSRVEGGPCTVLEAMACGAAVVATRVGAVPDLIVDGINGMSAPVDDRDALIAALVELAGSPQKHEQIVRQARETVSALPWGAVLSPLEAVYDRLIELRRPLNQTADGPGWMRDPYALLHATCAADAFNSVISRLRKGSLKAVNSPRDLAELLSGQSPRGIASGAALFAGLGFRANPK